MKKIKLNFFRQKTLKLPDCPIKVSLPSKVFTNFLRLLRTFDINLTGKCLHYSFFSDFIYFHVYLFKIADNLQIVYDNAEGGFLDLDSYRIRECTTP